MKQELTRMLKDSSRLKADIKAAIMALPENPQMKKISGSPKCGIISSKDLFQSGNWTVKYHMFESQYEALCTLIDRTPIEKLLGVLKTTIAQGFFVENRERFKLHPKVVAAVSKLLEGA